MGRAFVLLQSVHRASHSPPTMKEPSSFLESSSAVQNQSPPTPHGHNFPSMNMNARNMYPHSLFLHFFGFFELFMFVENFSCSFQTFTTQIRHTLEFSNDAVGEAAANSIVHTSSCMGLRTNTN